MGLQEAPETVPDIYGLPAYKVSQMRAEIEPRGHDVRLVFGDKIFGQVSWLYTVICSPEDLLSLAQQCEALAVEAFNIAQIMERRRGH